MQVMFSPYAETEIFNANLASWEVTSVTNQEIVIQLGFVDLLRVSLDDFLDKLLINLFLSEFKDDRGEPLEKFYALSAGIPRQIPSAEMK